MNLPIPRPRPMTVFEADDPSLDPEAILHALPPRDRIFPGTLSLLLYGACAAGLALWPEFLGVEPKDPEFVPRLLTQRVDLVLDPSPLPTPKPGPSGGGDQGTGTRMHADPVPSESSQAEPLKAREVLPESLLPAINALPSAPGGNGRNPGSGPGTGGGTGGGTRGGSGTESPREPAFDFQLIPILRTRPQFTLAPGQTATATTVVVQITVEEDGRVSSAKAVQGPDFLRSNAEKSALGWTFEPLAKHGLKAPQSTRIFFQYRLEDFKR